MAEAGKVTLEGLNREVERIGSLLRSMNVQIDAIRTRVSDLEHLEQAVGNGLKISKDRSSLKAAGKDPGEEDDFGRGKRPGKDNGGKSGKSAGKDNGGKGQGKGQGKSTRK